MTLAANAARMVARKGRAMTLRRAGETDLPLKGVRQDGELAEVGDNTAAQQRFRVVIAATELAASSWTVKRPRRTDRLVVDGRVCILEDAAPRHDGEIVALYELLVCG